MRVTTFGVELATKSIVNALPKQWKIEAFQKVLAFNSLQSLNIKLE